MVQEAWTLYFLGYCLDVQEMIFKGWFSNLWRCNQNTPARYFVIPSREDLLLGSNWFIFTVTLYGYCLDNHSSILNFRISRQFSCWPFVTDKLLQEIFCSEPSNYPLKFKRLISLYARGVELTKLVLYFYNALLITKPKSLFNGPDKLNVPDGFVNCWAYVFVIISRC